jgi:uncharacterized membrane protein
MHRIEKSIEVGVPIRTAYNQWTQFEEFPRFMEGVESVKQLDDKRLHWRANIYGKTEEWDAVIEEQEPDQRITWHSTSGNDIAGKVSFASQDPNRTRINLEMGYDPEGAVENIGTWLGVVDRRIEADLKRFKEFIEKRGVETGGWRGEIENQQVVSKGK